MYDRMKHAPCGYLSISQEGYITSVNQAFLNWMGYKEMELLHQHIEILLSAANRLIFHTYFYPNINLHGLVEELFVRVIDGEGNSVPFLLNGQVYEHQGVTLIECIFMKMQKRMDYEEELRGIQKQLEVAYLDKKQALLKLEHLHSEIEEKQSELLKINEDLVIISNTDKLTGLNNRRFLQEKLEEQIQDFQESGIQFSLLLIDIDFFKKVNDTYGHLMGDIVLERLAKLLKSFARANDIPARYGGEEFTLIMPATDVQTSKEIAEALRRKIENADWAEIGTLTVSIGAATFSADSMETIVRDADRALYASKENGRNQITHITDL